MDKLLTKKIVEELKILSKIESANEDEKNAIRRMEIRSAFSAVESGVIDWLRSCKAKILNELNASRSIDELSENLFSLNIINNFQYDINEQGELVKRKLKLPTKNRILFAINTIAKCNIKNFNPKEIEGWNEFLKAIKIRDRITHPKEMDDLVITDEEHEICQDAVYWFAECTLKASDTFDEVIEKYI